jgi:urease beta subunit
MKPLEVTDEVRAFLAQLVPLAIAIESVRYEPGDALEIAYVDAKGRHELVRWTPTSWTDLDSA